MTVVCTDCCGHCSCRHLSPLSVLTFVSFSCVAVCVVALGSVSSQSKNLFLFVCFVLSCNYQLQNCSGKQDLPIYVCVCFLKIDVQCLMWLVNVLPAVVKHWGTSAAPWGASINLGLKHSTFRHNQDLGPQT